MLSDRPDALMPQVVEKDPHSASRGPSTEPYCPLLLTAGRGLNAPWKALENFKGLCPHPAAAAGWDSPQGLSPRSGNQWVSLSGAGEVRSVTPRRALLVFCRKHIPDQLTSFKNETCIGPCPDEAPETQLLPESSEIDEPCQLPLLATEKFQNPALGRGPIHIRNELCLQSQALGKARL